MHFSGMSDWSARCQLSPLKWNANLPEMLNGLCTEHGEYLPETRFPLLNFPRRSGQVHSLKQTNKQEKPFHETSGKDHSLKGRCFFSFFFIHLFIYYFVSCRYTVYDNNSAIHHTIYSISDMKPNGAVT